MAAEAPDPRAFETWEDAFQYPIPVVRKLEQQLRSNAGENREKLRSLVGASYRDLLSTAETIIDMESRMQRVESTLARVGQTCNTRNLDRIARNAAKYNAHARSRDAERYTFASQLAVLENCPVVMGRLIEREDGLLLVAKVLVVSRLLHKSLSQNKNKAPVIDQLRDRLSSLRAKLLRTVDKRLASAAGETATLLESMCAYSLATSSTPTDVLRHFHHVRMEEITRLSQHREGLHEHGLSAMRLCLQTCADTQAIFPRRLADALAKLKAQPIVHDPDIRALYELNLDVHERWIGDEARNYTPQPRHDELQRPEAEKLLHQWSKQAIAAFLRGIKSALDSTEDLKEVAALRQELIEMWILSGSRMAGVKSKNVLNDLRETMNGQLESIVRRRTQKLESVVGSMSSTFNAVASGEIPTMSLWNTSSAAADPSDGAQEFKCTILNTHQGRDASILNNMSAFDQWMDSVLQVKGIVKSMKETRWDDPFSDDVDVDDSGDEFGDSKQALLSDDDPRLLEEVTQDALSKALQFLGTSFQRVVEGLDGHEEKDLVVPRAVFVLRAIREISSQIPRLRLSDRSTPLKSPFTSDVLRPLHTALAEYVVQPSVEAYAKNLASDVHRKSRSHILWEGNPPLPAQPSPTVFRFMRDLVKRMSTVGSDLWAPAGVQVLKDLAHEQVDEVWRETRGSIRALGEKDKQDTAADSGAASNQAVHHEQPPDVEKQRHEKLTQLVFDVLYVQRFLSTSNARADPWFEGASKALHLDESGISRLRDKASEHGRKTYLLFALLA